jgi:hypothetical protein
MNRIPRCRNGPCSERAIDGICVSDSRSVVSACSRPRPAICRSMVRGPDRSGRTRHTRGPARRNADSVAHRTTPCASGREARRSLDRCPVSFIDLGLGRGIQIQAVATMCSSIIGTFPVNCCLQQCQLVSSEAHRHPPLAGTVSYIGLALLNAALFDTVYCTGGTD